MDSQSDSPTLVRKSRTNLSSHLNLLLHLRHCLSCCPGLLTVDRANPTPPLMQQHPYNVHPPSTPTSRNPNTAVVVRQQHGAIPPRPRVPSDNLLGRQPMPLPNRLARVPPAHIVKRLAVSDHLGLERDGGGNPVPSDGWGRSRRDDPRGCDGCNARGRSHGCRHC